MAHGLCLTWPRPMVANLLALVVVALIRQRQLLQLLPAHWWALVLKLPRPQLAWGARVHQLSTTVLGQLPRHSPPWHMPRGRLGMTTAAKRRRLPPLPWLEPVPADSCLPLPLPLGEAAPWQLRLTGCLRLALVTVRMLQ